MSLRWENLVDLHNLHGGLTVNLMGREPKKGYAVAVFPERTVIYNHILTNRRLVRFANDNADLLSDSRNYLGTWHDKSQNKHILDIVQVIPDLGDALNVARSMKQDAIFDLQAQVEIELKPLKDGV